MARRWVVIVAFLVGCGYVVGTFESGQVSGTRLKLVYYDFDGTRSITGIFDAVRGQACDVQLWTNGRFYCTPTPAEKVVYADATCTQKVALTSNDPCLVPDYVIERDYSDCNTPVKHLYQRGDSISITQYWYQSNQGCLGPVPTKQRDAYAVGAEVATASLAAIDRGLFQGGGRLQRQLLISEDGLRMLSGQLHDTQLNIDCSFVGRIGATTGTCVPLHDAPISYFQDASCSAPVAATRTDCDAPQVAVQFDACAATDKYFALGAPLASGALYLGTPEACHAWQAPTAHNYFSVGEELAVATPARNAARDGHRIVPIRFALDGMLYPDRALLDTQTMAECLPFKLADGHAYCLPFGGRRSTYYADPRCQMAVDVVTVYRGPETCGPAAPPAYALNERHDPSCANTHESRPVTNRHVGQLYELNSGLCVKHAAASNYIEYDVGPPLRLDELAAGEVMTDL